MHPLSYSLLRPAYGVPIPALSFVVREHNDCCRDRIVVLATSANAYDVELHRDTRVDTDDLYADRRRRVWIGDIQRREATFVANAFVYNWRSRHDQPFSYEQKSFRSLEGAAEWLAARIDWKCLPARFDRALQITAD